MEGRCPQASRNHFRARRALPGNPFLAIFLSMHKDIPCSDLNFSPGSTHTHLKYHLPPCAPAQGLRTGSQEPTPRVSLLPSCVISTVTQHPWASAYSWLKPKLPAVLAQKARKRVSEEGSDIEEAPRHWCPTGKVWIPAMLFFYLKKKKSAEVQSLLHHLI